MTPQCAVILLNSFEKPVKFTKISTQTELLRRNTSTNKNEDIISKQFFNTRVWNNEKRFKKKRKDTKG